MLQRTLISSTRSRAILNMAAVGVGANRSAARRNMAQYDALTRKERAKQLRMTEASRDWVTSLEGRVADEKEEEGAKAV